MATPYPLLGSITLGSANTTMSLTNLPLRKYLMIEIYTLATLTLITQLRFNNDSSGVDTVSGTYAYRISTSGGADTTSTNRTQISFDLTSLTPGFIRIYVVNVAANEKLLVAHHIDQNTTGAGNAPSRDEIVAKWANTSAQINEVDIITSTSTFTVGSTLTVYGSD